MEKRGSAVVVRWLSWCGLWMRSSEEVVSA